MQRSRPRAAGFDDPTNQAKALIGSAAAHKKTAGKRPFFACALPLRYRRLMATMVDAPLM
jgi:hypothetical protein